MLPERGGASTTRARLLTEIALGMSAERGATRPYRDVQISLGVVNDGAFNRALSFAAGPPDVAFAVARRDLDLAALNPSPFLTMAYRGTGPFPQPLPLRALAIMPSWDRMAFAVAERTGITSFDQIRERKPPLRISLRENPAHATRFVIDQVLSAAGISLRDIEAWGGRLEYTNTPSEASRMDGVRSGTLDAVFDEGIKGWGNVALEHGMRFLALDPATQHHLETLGWPLGPTPRAMFPRIADELLAPTFSGWPLLVHADLPDDVAYAMCRALDAARGSIQWDIDGPVEMRDLAGGTDAAPRDVPLHPGAERYYREIGALS
ncbi:MAG TPA: TAXI family TRAP transporter solute-binding subunit [Chloroflexota bacterium]|nr:TAXI family TRAP transporter solute-binding subunit [Chloroflexota bacterium]